MKVSREGIVLIKSFEGFRPRAVPRPDGSWVIGYGHTASAREGLTVGEADAELLLQYDLIPVVKALHDQVAAPLNQHQFDALASFAFSLGVERFAGSDVLARINAGAQTEAADALFGWPEPPGAEAALRRRAAERALFVAAPDAQVTLADLLAAPLPLPPAAEPDADPEPEPQAERIDARAAAVAHLLGEPASDAPAESAPAPTPSEPPSDAAPGAEPAVEARHSALSRYSPYQAAVIGPLITLDQAPTVGGAVIVPFAPLGRSLATAEPAAPLAEETAEPAPEPAIAEPVAQPAEHQPALAEEVVETPVETPAITEVAPEPEPSQAVAPEPLILTPPLESPAAEARPVWTPDQRGAEAAVSDDGAGLFEGAEDLGPVIRREIEPAALGRDWSETGAFLVMGGIGLVSFGAAMAAFRRAALEGSGGEQTALIGWVLAVIALICVGVSSFNLYQRWGRSAAD